MFCKVCGSENRDSSSYCVNDGVRLTKFEDEVFLESSFSKFCSECGSEGLEESVYCSNCGSATFSSKISDSKAKMEIPGFDVKLGDMKLPKMEDYGLGDVKGLDRFKPGLIGFGLSVVLGFLLSSVFNLIAVAMLQETFGGFSMDLKLISTITSVPILSLPKASLSVGGNAAGSARVGYFLPLLIGVLQFGVIGYISAGKDQKRDIKDLLLNAGVYGGLMALVSIIARKSVDVPFVGKISLKYSFLSVLIHSIVIAVMGLMAGYGFRRKFKGFSYDSELENKILDSNFTFFSIFIAFSIIMLLVFGIKNDLPRGSFLLTFQAVAYLFGIVNLGSLKMDNYGLYDQLSLFKNGEALKDSLNISRLFLLLFLVLIIAYMFKKGRDARIRGDGFFYVLPLTYSILSTLILRLLSVSVDTGYAAGNIFVGFNTILFLVGVLLLTGASNFAGYMIGGGVEVEAN